MPVTSFDYFCFLTLVFFAFWSLRRYRQAPVALICLANLYFYARWGLPYLVLIPAASGVDYFLGRRIALSTKRNTRRALVSVSIAVNLGLIVLCRYVTLPGLGR